MGCSELFLAVLLLALLAAPFVGLVVVFARLRDLEARLDGFRREQRLLVEQMVLDAVRPPAASAKEPPTVSPLAPDAAREGAGVESATGEPFAPKDAAPQDVPEEFAREAAPPLTPSATDRFEEPEPVPTMKEAPLDAWESAAERAPEMDATPAAPPPLPTPAGIGRPRRRVEWERRIGVRGAAVVGAVVLGLAGFLFLKYSIEHGLLPPIVRVAAGLLAGLGCVVGSEGLRRRRHGYRATADALAGSGVTLLYAAVWAARVLYALIGAGFAFFLMVLVTLACGALSWRHHSRVVAVLGLVGGFATPALLSSGADRPISLFGYLLLLNLAVLVVAARRGWTPLLGLSLVLTTLYEVGWVFGRMNRESALIGLLVVAVFAVFFVFGTRNAADPRSETGRRSLVLIQVAGVLAPFAMTFYFAGNAELGRRLYPLAVLLLLLILLASWLGRQHQRPEYGTAAAAAAVAAVTVWAGRTSFDSWLEWELVFAGLALALAPHVAWELGGRGRDTPETMVTAERVAAAGFLALLVAVPLFLEEPAIWPWLTAWTGLSALLWRQSTEPRGAFLQLPAAISLAVGAGVFFLAHNRTGALVYGLAAGVACQVVAQIRRDSNARRWSESAAVILPLLLVLLLAPAAARPDLEAWVFFAAVLIGGALATLAATRLGWGVAYFAVLVVVALDGWLWSEAGAASNDSAVLWVGFWALALATVACTIWPFLAGAAFGSEPWAWYASALAGPAFFFSLLGLFSPLFGDDLVGLLSVALAGLSVGALERSRLRWRSDDAFGRRRVCWFAGVTFGFFGVGLLQAAVRPGPAWIFFATLLAGAALATLAATRLGAGVAYFLVLAGVALDGWLWSGDVAGSGEGATLLLGFAALSLTAVAFTLWPFLTGAVFRSERWAWYASALAGPFFFFSLLQLFDALFGDSAVGLLPVALAGLSAAALARSREAWRREAALGRSRVVWFAAVTLGFVSAAIPLQLEKEWITLGWAFEGFAALVLWRRLDHAGLKYFGLALLMAASGRLVLNPAVLGYYPRSGWPVINWLLYTYLAPAAALAFSARVLLPLEVQRRRPWERLVYLRPVPVAAILCGFLAVVVVFVWVNLAVFDYFSTGERLVISLNRLQARDLTLSLCWIAYALTLLGAGMARAAKPLRWVSLGLLMLALAKVFVYDLGELEDLYRVGSLVGLAVSLLAVSLAYQRFVFGGREASREDK